MQGIRLGQVTPPQRGHAERPQRVRPMEALTAGAADRQHLLQARVGPLLVPGYARGDSHQVEQVEPLGRHRSGRQCTLEGRDRPRQITAVHRCLGGDPVAERAGRRVVQRFGERQALAQQPFRGLDSALDESEFGVVDEGHGHVDGRTGGCGEGLPEPVLVFAVPPTAPRMEAPQRHEDAHSRVGLAGLGDAELQGGTDVREFGVESGEPVPLPRADPVVIGLPCHPLVPVAVPAGQPGVLARLSQSLLAELPDGLEHAKPRDGAGPHADDDGLVDQGRQDIENIFRRQAIAGADALGRIQLEPPGEDGQPGPQRPLLPGAQFVAPLDACSQRRLPCRRPARRRLQELVPIVEATGDGVRGQCPDPRGGKFNGQWQAFQLMTDLGDRDAVVFAEYEIGCHGRGAVGEQ